MGTNSTIDNAYVAMTGVRRAEYPEALAFDVDKIESSVTIDRRTWLRAGARMLKFAAKRSAFPEVVARAREAAALWVDAWQESLPLGELEEATQRKLVSLDVDPAIDFGNLRDLALLATQERDAARQQRLLAAVASMARTLAAMGRDAEGASRAAE